MTRNDNVSDITGCIAFQNGFLLGLKRFDFGKASNFF
jgi:hypothetical protein